MTDGPLIPGGGEPDPRRRVALTGCEWAAILVLTAAVLALVLS